MVVPPQPIDDDDPARRFRLALLSRGERLPGWQLAALRELLSEPGAELVLAIDASRVRGSPSRDARARREERPAPPAALPSNPLAVVSAAAELAGVPRAGANDAQAEIEARGVDLVWCADTRNVPAHLVTAAAGGAWALDVDDGDPACISALVRAKRHIGSRLLRLSAVPRRARVLAEAHFLNEPFAPALTRSRVLYGCARLPARQLRAWRLGTPPTSGADVVLRAAPARRRGLLRAALPARQAVSLAKRAWASCFRDQWSVGISRRPISAFLAGGAPDETTWLAEPPGGDFHADAFGLETPDGVVLLAEGYDAQRALGRIDVLRPANNAQPRLVRDVLPQDGHLSYPYLFRHGEQVYCVPESHQQRRVALYRADPFPERWSLAATLLEDFAGVDSTVFRHEGRWWLLLSNQDYEPYAGLYGFFAEHLTGPWQPHALNPLKLDPRSSRPAGTPFVHEGALYRPAQDCSTGYGGAVVINRVDSLTPTTFSERPAARIAPDPEGPYPHGLHTLAAVGEVTVIDGMRWVFAPSRAFHAAIHFLRRLQKYRAGTNPPRSDTANAAD